MSETLPSPEQYREIIVDDKLTLREVSLENTEEFFALVDNNREYLGKWLPWVKNNTRPEDSENFIEYTKEQREQGSTYGFGLFYENKLVGHASLMHITDEKTPEIGYWIAEEASGKGITTSAAKALTDFGFDSLGLNKIIIRAEPGNIGSNKVAEKLGYKIVGQKIHENDGVLLNIWEISSHS
jgi:ribosomal-protein-serine acetyltransferase